jgi:hypothetical protein
LLTGTFVSSLTDSAPIYFLGMETHGVQYTTLMRAVTMMAMGLFLVLRWRSFTRDEEVEDIEQAEKVRKAMRASNQLKPRYVNPLPKLVTTLRELPRLLRRK